MPKINIFPLIVRDGLVLAALYSISKERGFSSLFDILQAHGVKLKFLSHIGRKNNGGDIIFCLEKRDYGRVKRDLEGLMDSGVALGTATKSPVAIIRILGPHFDIRTRISARIYGALEGEGIEVLGNSTTVTTCLLVVAQEAVEKALRALRRFFQDEKKR